MAKAKPDRSQTRGLARDAVAIVVGVFVAAVVAPFLGLAAGLLAGWAALGFTSVSWTLLILWPMNAAQTKSHATVEDPARSVARLIALIGSLTSLAAVGVVLVYRREVSETVSLLLALIAVLSVVASWALIQVGYMVRVAAVYYTEPVGGISFNQDDDPMYTDFAYFAVGLGMTYQVADTNVRTNDIRRIVIAQTLLAYLFGSVILASIINLVTSLG